MSTAKWKYTGYNSEKKSVQIRNASLNYSGQSVTMNAVKAATAISDSQITWTNSDEVVNGVTFYGVEPIPVWDEIVVYITIEPQVRIEI